MARPRRRGGRLAFVAAVKKAISRWRAELPRRRGAAGKTPPGVAGFYYYLRIVAAMYWQEPNDDRAITMNPLSKFVVGLLTAAIFFFGIFPQPLLNSLRGAPAPIAQAAR